MNRKSSAGVSSSVAGAAAVVALIVGLLIGGIGLGPILSPAQTITQTKTVATTATVTAAAGLTGEVTIGSLLCLSAVLSSYAENERVAMDLAAREVNDFLQRAGAGFRIRMIHEDTACNPATAEEKIRSLNARGVKLVVGPMTSAEVRQIKSYVDANKILIISQSSTAPDLKIPNDFVFRFTTADDIQGPIGPRLAKLLGITHFLYVWRGDAWGDGLHTVSTGEAKKLGLNLVFELRYAPDKTEFSAEVSQLNAKVTELLNQGVSPDKIMVEIVGFDEVVAFLSAANEYPNLKRIKWFGSDGTAVTAAIFQDPAATGFAEQVKWINPLFFATTPDRKARVDAEVLRVLGRSPPDAYSYAAYSAVWAYALALMATQKYDAEAVRAVLPTIAADFLSLKLDDAGDLPYSDYILWVVKTVDGKPRWVEAGRYVYASGTFEWAEGFTP
ncbi:branched-chain amino acid ABC transporter substrate-binding protein [Candidatus Caldarchaeum subterraneum]|uniref:Branched-chain amino acid ABC transporter substrate-binding protein n=1 Tax=Caldiarchaeum subterraneum TaxID=311458 RepID=E6N8D6_CALS0|nr:branched-chain amino acid ABC transporter substrate-binding protein [Candidatus Caldarchaeum subterraneum]BAJ48599.1 branched-chain amino acid ABC transporter substrate-binding protein [Candidatus Caldarchaeum subterraneum]BAJ51307.1 branched-chain amino acid ABC transporter substrate-binding protein [Candidatus Caldarchaeum subterraneum]